MQIEALYITLPNEASIQVLPQSEIQFRSCLALPIPDWRKDNSSPAWRLSKFNLLTQVASISLSHAERTPELSIWRELRLYFELVFEETSGVHEEFIPGTYSFEVSGYIFSMEIWISVRPSSSLDKTSAEASHCVCIRQSKALGDPWSEIPLPKCTGNFWV